jgi:hypothetical protein
MVWCHARGCACSNVCPHFPCSEQTQFIDPICRLSQLLQHKRLRVEDGIMIACTVTYTILIVAINVVMRSNTNLLGKGEPVPTLPADIQSRITGSKWVIVLEQSAIQTCWGNKACFLIMYHRLTYVICLLLPGKTLLICTVWVFDSTLPSNALRHMWQSRGWH